MSDEYKYDHTHGEKQYLLFYDIDDGLRWWGGPPLDSDYNWTITLAEAWDVTGLDLSDPADHEHWKAVPLEDLPSRPAKEDVLDEYHHDAWYRHQESLRQ
jgi:hypothetical protein